MSALSSPCARTSLDQFFFTYTTALFGRRTLPRLYGRLEMVLCVLRSNPWGTGGEDTPGVVYTPDAPSSSFEVGDLILAPFVLAELCCTTVAFLSSRCTTYVPADLAGLIALSPTPVLLKGFNIFGLLVLLGKHVPQLAQNVIRTLHKTCNRRLRCNSPDKMFLQCT